MGGLPSRSSCGSSLARDNTPLALKGVKKLHKKKAPPTPESSDHSESSGDDKKKQKGDTGLGSLV